MADVVVDMEPGTLSVKGEDVPGSKEKVRRLNLASEETWARLKELELRKQELAAERGPWKDATREQRAEARAIAEEIAAVKQELLAEHEAGKDIERDKQAKASEREAALRGDNV